MEEALLEEFLCKNTEVQFCETEAHHKKRLFVLEKDKFAPCLFCLFKCSPSRAPDRQG